MPGQRRGRAIAMNAGEMDSFLGEQRTCRVATLGPGGGPHVSPVWFVWDTDALWIYSLTRSQRWADVSRDPRVAVVIDAGGEPPTRPGQSRSRVPSPMPRRRRQHPYPGSPPDLLVSRSAARPSGYSTGYNQFTIFRTGASEEVRLSQRSSAAARRELRVGPT